MTTLADFRLPPRLRRTVATLAPLVGGEQIDDLGIADEIVASFELSLRSIPAALRVAMVAGLYALEHSARTHPTAFGRPLSDLGRRAARAHFDAWWQLPGGHQLAKAIKMFLALAIYDHPAVRRRLGYDPAVWIEKVKTARSARHYDAIEAHEAMILAPSPLLSALEEATTP